MPEADFTIGAGEATGCEPHEVNPVNNSLNGWLSQVTNTIVFVRFYLFHLSSLSLDLD